MDAAAARHGKTKFKSKKMFCTRMRSAPARPLLVLRIQGLLSPPFIRSFQVDKSKCTTPRDARDLADRSSRLAAQPRAKRLRAITATCAKGGEQMPYMMFMPGYVS